MEASPVIVFKKVWHDPVGSKVIGSAIYAAVAGAAVWLAYRLHWLPGWMTRTAATVWRNAWAFLLASSAVQHWLLILLVLLSVPTILLAAYLAWTLIFPEKATGPDWTSYTTDSFGGLLWRWRYANGDIDRLLSFCPVCDLQLFPDSTSTLADRISFHCESCGETIATHQGPYRYFEGTIKRLIQRKLRTEKWRKTG
jgi:hypothetical protein